MQSRQCRNAVNIQTLCLEQPALSSIDDKDAACLWQACSAFQTCCRQESLPRGLSEGAAPAALEALQWSSPAPFSTPSFAQCLPAGVHACISLLQGSSPLTQQSETCDSTYTPPNGQTHRFFVLQKGIISLAFCLHVTPAPI